VADAVAESPGGDGSESRIVIRSDWKKRLLNELFALFIALILLFAGALVLLDTAPGHRFIADRIAGMETATGLKFRIGRIDGSIFGDAKLRHVRVSDQQGVFLTSPEIDLDWAPAAWLNNTLSIDSVTAEQVDLIRLPRLKPTGRKGPILPAFDIRIGQLRIDRLNIGQGVAGKARSGRVVGSADIRSGRALIDLKVLVADGGDKLNLRLDAEPDRDKFDIEARIVAPGDGVLPALVGTKRAIGLMVTGQGSWTRWRGMAALNLSNQPALRLALGADSGRYRLRGSAAPARFLKGRLRDLTAPVVNLSGNGSFVDRVLDGTFTAASPALRAVVRGAVDFAGNEYRDVRLGVDLLRPPALFDDMRGKNVRLVWTLDGAFDSADYSYRLTSPQVQFDDTGFIDLRAEGAGRLSAWPMRVPLRLSARAITGIGDVAGDILARPRIEGWLSVSPQLIRGDNLKLTSAKVNGKLSILIDLVTGNFEVALSGTMKRYFIEGIGIVDVLTDLKVVPGPGGRGTLVVGKAKVWVRRLDNDFFASLTDGLPRLETDLRRGADGVLHLTNLQFYSPGLRLSGSGHRRTNGTFMISASGRQAEYGPLRVTLDGPIERPRIDLLLARPNDTLGLSNVRLQLNPTNAGFDYRAAGGSRLGAFTSNGAILLPDGAPVVIAIAALNAGDLSASGRLRSDPGGFSGRLTLAGASLAGTLDFAPVNGAQKIEAHLDATNADLPALSVRTGRIDGSIILADGRTTVTGTIDARGISAAGIDLARLTANANLVNGSGQVRAAFAGRRGADFSFATTANVSPDRISISGKGEVEGRALALEEPAVLTRSGDGWALSPTSLTFAGGSATVSGRSGARPEVHAELRGMPLEVLNIANPELDLSGTATGRLDYAWSGNRSGRLDLKVRGLSRAGLVLSSRPVDVGVAAVINDGNAALRAVAVSEGKTIGRAQARFAPLGNGPIVAELMNAPLFAQLRYAGSADTLWRLTGSEIFDLSGPISIGADVGGRATDPQIRGSVRVQNGRLESPVTGTVITGLNVEARFSGPQLLFTQLGGATPGGGSIDGRGSVTFSGGNALLDLAFTANRAQLLKRDDISATVTGPLTVRSDGNGGTIAGDLKLDTGRFRLGRATAASVPQLKVHETGLSPEEVIETADLQPWRLDIKVAGGNLRVDGLGLNSRWRTTLDIGGTADSPRFTGRADLSQGNYDFAGRNFRLDRGIIRFNGESPPNPQLDIHAEAQVQGLNAGVSVKGTGLAPEITFTSVPALPQDELLSRILFGTSITNLSAPEALQLASAVAALQSGSGSLDPINALRKAIGLDRLRIVSADVATGQKTAIGAGKYITRKLFVEVVTDGQGYSATRVEYQMSRWLSILSTISTLGRSSASVRVSKDY
jgi:translocation and assembly module TamB